MAGCHANAMASKSTGRRFNKPERGRHREKVADIARQVSFELGNADFAYAHGDKDRVFSRMMENADKWVDPTLTVEENRKAAKKRYGLRTKGEALEEFNKADGINRDRAREAIRANAEAIADGGATDLLDDIAAEYGREWVNQAVAAEVGGPVLDTPAEPTKDTAEPTASSPTGRARLLSRVPRPFRGLAVSAYVLFRYTPEGVSQ